MATKNKNTFPKRGAAQPFISLNDSKNLKIILPDLNIIREFSDMINNLYTHMNILMTKNNNLKKTRDLLLPKLISGKIDVSELDIDLEGQISSNVSGILK